MDFYYAAVTANCGNGPLGEQAVDAILDKLNAVQGKLHAADEGTAAQGPLDFLVINCQETKYDLTLAELEKYILDYNKLKETHYAVSMVAKMNTRTKFKLNELLGCGMATYVIYDSVKLEFAPNPEVIEARRKKTHGEPRSIKAD